MSLSNTHCFRISHQVQGREPPAYLWAVQEEEVQQLQALPHHFGVGERQGTQQQGQGSPLVQLLAVGGPLLCNVAQHCQDLGREAVSEQDRNDGRCS